MNFNDRQDKNHSYQVDEVYPRAGYVASDKRLSELSSSNNKLRRPVIEKVKEEKPNKVKEEENV